MPGDLTALPPSPAVAARRRFAAVLGLVALLAAFGAYATFVADLASTPVDTTQRVEKEIRGNSVVSWLTPEGWRRHPPQEIDLYLHFAFSVPTGLLAALAALLGARFAGNQWRNWFLAIAFAIAILGPAWDEFRQIPIPMRNATTADLTWAWGGVLAGFAGGWGAVALGGGLRRLARRQSTDKKKGA